MDRIKEDLPSFQDFIKNLINQRYEEFGGKAKDFAKTIGLDDVSLSRYRNKGCPIDSPKAKALLGVLLKDEDQYSELMMHYYKEDSDLWEYVHSQRKYSNQSKSMLVNTFVKRNALYHSIFSMASLDNGLPFDFVEKVWPVFGVEYAQEMVDAGILEWDGERFIGVNKKHTYGDLDAVKSNAVNLVSQYPVENSVHKEGVLANAVGNLNEEGVAALRTGGFDAAQGVIKILENPKYQGDIPVSATLVMGKLKFADFYTETVRKLSKSDSKEDDNES